MLLALVVKASSSDNDSDNGGVSDRVEVNIHISDPLDPSDDGRGWLEEGAGITGGGGCAVLAAPVSRNGTLLVFILCLVLGFLRQNSKRPQTRSTWKGK